MVEGVEYDSSSSSATAQCFGGGTLNLPAALLPQKKKKSKSKIKLKRRFNDEQIRSLETMFQFETKLEPSKKLQLARDLGLHPRQVAIWFQNKRARWKSKQLEKDYSLLRSNYNTLASQFQTLNYEKQSLLAQLQKLKDLIEKSQKNSKEGQCRREDQEVSAGISSCKVSDINNKSEFELNPVGISLEYGVLSDDDDSGIKTEYFGLDEDDAELVNLVEPTESSLTSPEEWGSLQSDALLDQPTSSYQWWDFWS